MARLSEAHARIRLSPTVDLDDATAAIEIYNEYVKAVAQDAGTGELNFAAINSPSASQQERERTIKDAARALERSTGDRSWSIEELVQAVAPRHITRAQVEATFANRQRRGREIMEPRADRFRLVE